MSSSKRQMRRRFIVGVGMTIFMKPGQDWDYPQMAKIAGERALADAQIDYKEVEQAYASYVSGDSTCGQRAVYELGLSGIPIVNVNNNCSSGSSALMLAAQAVGGGVVDCAMALGFEKMEKGSLGSKFDDRTNPMDKHMMVMVEKRGFAPAPPAAQLFGNAGLEHHEKYGSNESHLIKIAKKNHDHSANNPYSQFRDTYTLEQVKKDKKVFADLTKSMCCPTSDGAGCVIVASEEFVKRHGLEGQAVEILGQSLRTDYPSAFEGSMIKMVGSDMARAAAEDAYRQAGIKPTDVQVCELHDCFASNELITYEALGFCKEGEAHKWVDAGKNDYGGQVVVNPSGGLISKGHPLGATGLAQAAEIVWQLRNEAGPRQVKGVRVGLTHNLGLGGAAVVTVYKRPDEWLSKPMKRKVSLGAGIPKELIKEPVAPEQIPALVPKL